MHNPLKSIVFFLIVGKCISQDVPKVKTHSGEIIGHYLISYQKNKYEAYEGIPYALPPTGERRFKPPIPINPWSNELNATKKGNSCLGHQREPVGENNFVSGDEDCLYLNIYTPIRKANETFPVIFWIHGGAFQYGAGTEYGPKYLIDHNVIFVTINYRLGVLGFLSTENEVVPGNMGLKDQSVALRWISENIKYFGGDPKKITLTGLSAGGASVHYHYLSPMSAGLFHSGISFSGTAFDCWTQTENSRGNAIKIAELMNCPTNNVRKMVKCLQSRPGKLLVATQIKFMPWRLNPFTPFGPVVEKFGKNPFIDRSPIEIINSGDVQDLPWITGVTKDEGLYPVAEFALKEDALKDLDGNWELIAPYLLDYNYTIPTEKHAVVAREIRKHYFANKPINRENLQPLTRLVGDRIFSADAQKAAVAMAYANVNPVRFFYYSYRASTSLSEHLSHTSDNLGVCHGDDVILVIENVYIDPTASTSDFAMHKDLVKFWVSVARYGVPKFGHRWQRVNPKKPSLDYLHMAGPGNFKMEADVNLSERHFWDSIDFNENKLNQY